MGIPLFKVGMSGLAPRRAAEVLMSGYIGQGPKVEEFEREFEKLNGFPVGSFVSTNSCTSAIELVLRYLNLGPQSVVVTPMTCIATAAPVLNQRAEILWAGVTHKGLIRFEDVQQHMKNDPGVGAIIGVDWTGRLPDYTRLKLLGVPVIQDAAHDPYLAEYALEELGDYVCFSFGPIKHLTTIDGGGVYVNSALYRDEIVKALKLLRWYGLDRASSKDFRCEQDIEEPGMKWHMNDVSAAVGLSNMRNLKDIIQMHRRNAEMLEKGIDNPWITKHGFDPRSNYWVYPLLVEHYRDRFVKYMNANGVGCSRVHRRGDTHPGYLGPATGLKMIQWFDDSQANLPCGWWMQPEDVQAVIAIVNAFDPEKVPA
jgi:dTDP-4-amino-4,6-dideoxygalactose transaminase